MYSKPGPVRAFNGLDTYSELGQKGGGGISCKKKPHIYPPVVCAAEHRLQGREGHGSCGERERYLIGGFNQRVNEFLPAPLFR